jgi:hypothetical protein
MPMQAQHFRIPRSAFESTIARRITGAGGQPFPGHFKPGSSGAWTGDFRSPSLVLLVS